MKKIAILGGASCSGCDVALFDLPEDELERFFSEVEVVFWSTTMDSRIEDFEAQGKIDLVMFHGGIRTEEHRKLLIQAREKAEILVALGSCASFGGIPGIANLFELDAILKDIYGDEFTKLSGERIPKPEERLKPISSYVKVDYYLPGCPPPVETISEFLDHFILGSLPPRGIFGKESTVCDECDRIKPEDISIEEVKRIGSKDWSEIDPKVCFLAQGVVCLGAVTRGGCKARCINANFPCRGCMGPAPNIRDQGARILSEIASLLMKESEKNLSDEEIYERVQKEIVDPVGLFYRYTLPHYWGGSNEEAD